MAGVPDGKGEHAAQVVDTVASIFFVEVDNGLGVAVGAVAMALGCQAFSQSRMVVDFSVENDPDRAVFVADGLVAGGEIDDAQAAHAQAHGAVGEHAFVVGPAVQHGAAHLADGSGFDLAILREVDYTGDSTHRNVFSRPGTKNPTADSLPQIGRRRQFVILNALG